MQWSPQLRERRLAGAHYAQALQEQIESTLPDAALRDGVLVDPMHHGQRAHTHPWWHRLWRKVGRHRSNGRITPHAG